MRQSGLLPAPCFRAEGDAGEGAEDRAFVIICNKNGFVIKTMPFFVFFKLDHRFSGLHDTKQRGIEPMATAQMYITLAKNFFQRSNPIEALATSIIQGVYALVTLRSRLKLMKYRYMLEAQKLERIEKTLNEFNPYEFKGNKVNRTY